MIVIKFGGTSLENAGAIRNVVQLINRHIERRPVIVVSACAGTTDALIRMADHAEKGQIDAALRLLLHQRQRHLRICDEILVDGHRESAHVELQRRFSELARRLYGLSILRELTPRVRDSILSMGESWSALLLTHALQQDGREAIWIPAERLVVTDDRHGEASPQMEATRSNLFDLVVPQVIRGQIVVTQGFVGTTPDGHVSTLGRGGSDFTAGVLGALVGAEEIQIWTDVDGFRSADPRYLHDAQPHPVLSYRDAERFAALGAKVLHPKAVAPAERQNIPIRILNTRRPDDEGTWIGPSGNERAFCITHKTGLSLITFEGDRPVWLSEVVNEAEVITLDPVGIQILLKSDARVAAPAGHRKNHLAICWVTSPEWNASFTARALDRLNEAGIEVHSMFRRDPSIGFVIAESSLVETIRLLHEGHGGNEAESAIAKSA